MSNAPAVALAHVKVNHPPGPHGRWRISSAPDVARDPLGFYMRMRERYGDIVRMPILPGLHWYFVAHPAGVEHVLQSNQQNYPKANVFRKTFGMLLGDGLFTSEGAQWRRQRRLAQPAFNHKRLAMFGAVITGATERMLRRWDDFKLSGTPFDVSAEMTRLTLEITGLTLLSIDISEQASRFGDALRRAFGYIDYRMSNPFALPLFVPTPRNIGFKKFRGVLDEIIYGIVNERRVRLEDKGDLLSTLLLARDQETGEGMSDRELRDEVLTLLLAGHETVASALSWTWYLLAKHPEVVSRLRSELDAVLDDGMPTTDDLPRLPYTRMIFEEAMRLYPPAWVMMRQAKEADTISGYRIPRKALVVVSQYVTHRHPAYWEEPDKFVPERFTAESAADRPRFAYFPFGGGSRQCMGNNYTIMEAQLILATIVPHLHPQLVPGMNVEVEPSFTLRPHNGLFVRL